MSTEASSSNPARKPSANGNAVRKPRTTKPPPAEPALLTRRASKTVAAGMAYPPPSSLATPPLVVETPVNKGKSPMASSSTTKMGPSSNTPSMPSLNTVSNSSVSASDTPRDVEENGAFFSAPLAGDHLSSVRESLVDSVRRATAARSQDSSPPAPYGHVDVEDNGFASSDPPVISATPSFTSVINPPPSISASSRVVPGLTNESITAGLWESEHLNLNWDTLEGGIRDIAAVRVTTQDLTSFVTNDGVVLYSLGADLLERVAQIALAVHQVLGGLHATEFYRQRPAENVARESATRSITPVHPFESGHQADSGNNLIPQEDRPAIRFVDIPPSLSAVGQGSVKVLPGVVNPPLAEVVDARNASAALHAAQAANAAPAPQDLPTGLRFPFADAAATAARLSPTTRRPSIRLLALFRKDPVLEMGNSSPHGSPGGGRGPPNRGGGPPPNNPGGGGGGGGRPPFNPGGGGGPPFGNPGGGGGPPNGGGGPPNGGGGPPAGPAGNAGNFVPDWQINRKINFSMSSKQVFIVDASETGASAAHLPRQSVANRNVRRREAHDALKVTAARKGKAKEVVDLGPSRRIARAEHRKMTAQRPVQVESDPVEAFDPPVERLPEHLKLSRPEQRVEKAIRARSSAQGVDLGFDLRRVLAVKMKPYLKRTADRRERARSARLGEKRLPEVYASADVLVPAGSVHNVPIHGPFDGRDDWLVEKLIIGEEDENVLAAPTTWINTSCPVLPIANPSTRPRYIRKGEIVGHLRDPTKYADKPKDEEHLAKLVASADAIRTTIEKRERAQDIENQGDFAAAPRAAYSVLWWDEVLESYDALPVTTRSQAQKDKVEDGTVENSQDASPAPRNLPSSKVEGKAVEIPAGASPADDLPFPDGDHWTYPTGISPSKELLEEEIETQTHILFAANPEFIKGISQGYRKDSYFRKHFVDSMPSPETLLTPSRFQKGKNGLLYFLDADWNARVCIPRSKVPQILKWVHDSSFESAHAGPDRFLARLRETFYWPRMDQDVETFGKSCDVCQKIKEDRRGPMGGLRPAHIPSRPFATVSLDLITGLPPSGKEKFTAVLVIVDKLTKYALMIPTYNELKQEGFARFFVERVANVYGLPERIIADRDKRWATAFWRSVFEYYGASYNNWSTRSGAGSREPTFPAQSEGRRLCRCARVPPEKSSRFPCAGSRTTG
ncbi:hypothetical protein R3P38DRAFT_2768273 [Favolaschia claudopus]|uniref:Integrase catalytic domain-containing protein n=1 Tax=Favolaschia claudopus TaxID=2862362 RepID=A0AAW0CVD9_9AGAR